MKLIKTETELISLENVIRVLKIENGTGAKSNPLTYSIRIDYFNSDNCCFVRCGQDQTKRDNVFEEIADILSN
jgi:hypothetical protein